MTDDSSRQAAELFRAALDYPPDERTVFVSEACRNSSTLRAEVESLLSLHSQGQDFLARLPAATDAYMLLSGEGQASDPPETIPSGRRLGDYRIDERIGAGGMGVVYKAHDSRLGRVVAIKVLPAHLSGDTEALTRLEREAKLLASLNHPNVATIHRLEECDGIRFLVLEMVAGQTLQKRLSAGSLPIAEALDICRQIAEGLEAAHERGVIHRDLKPSNIKFTPDGKVKLLDFGLAKPFAVSKASASRHTSEAVTLDGPTKEGIVRGTAAYMSPEQARGQLLDKRTDIWSFGCVLFEVLSGKQAFPGATLSDTLAAVLEREPDWSVLPRSTPANIAVLLRRCLHKDPARRLHDIADARIEIEETTGSPSGVTALGSWGEPLRAAERVLWRRMLPWAVAGLTALTAARALWRVQPPTTPRIVKFSIPLSEPELTVVRRPLFALAPDGTALVYRASSEGATRLFLRALNEFESEPLPGTEGASRPFFSPDGQSIGFFTDDGLKKTSIKGGTPELLCDAPNAFGGTWGSDGWIYFASQLGYRLQRIPASGGTGPQDVPMTPDHPGRVRGSWPVALPGGRALLITSGSGQTQSVDVLSLKTGRRHTLIPRGSYATYVPTGHLVYARSGTLYAVPFDLDKLEVTPPSVPVLPGVRTEFWGAAQYALSDEGTLAFVPGRSMADGTLVWMSREPGAKPKVAWPGKRAYGAFTLSPDGKRLAIQIPGAFDSISIFDFERSTEIRLPRPGDASDMYPTWSPDGEWIAFRRAQGETSGLYRWRADGSGDVEALMTSRYEARPHSFSPDGRLLAYQEKVPEQWWNIGVLHLDEDRTNKEFLATPAGEWDPKFSPDGKWIAYKLSAPGHGEVYVRPFPKGEPKFLVSSRGGEEPIWSPKGDELFYRSRDKWMVVPITTEPVFSPGTPRLMFEGSFLSIPGPSYDYDPVNDRFLLVARRDDTPQTEIRVVLNWFQELERLAPAGRD